IGRSEEGDIERLCSQLVSLGLREDTDEESKGVHPRIVSLVERQVIRQVLFACQGVQTKAAAKLGINRNTLHKKIAEYGLESDVR
ncbi:MAG: helix-turn-helix domain-containing protein, partial [Planctomycetota bacterium]|nr:helix-turn-helix domain-containing protein [Planctomycetota bacterium]